MNHPYFVTAADEALTISCSEYGAVNTLHFYRRDPPAISVGYFRPVAEDIDIESCKALGITVVRRTSGGGSIYTDRNQLIFSIITDHPLGRDVEDSFKGTCSCLIDALAACGISASYKPPNDVLINGRKVSGSAQIRKKKAYMTHGTIILTLDYDIITRVLKNIKRGYTSSILQECGFVPKIEVLKAAVKRQFQKRFEIEFQSGEFTERENKLIQDLIENKYSTDAWNFKR